MPPASFDLGGAGPDARPLTVTEFTRRVRAALEGAIGSCWVRGEVSNLHVHPSGHVYFSLKDAGAQLSAVMFRAQAARQTVKLRDGLQVIAHGDVGVGGREYAIDGEDGAEVVRRRPVERNVSEVVDEAEAEIAGLVNLLVGIVEHAAGCLLQSNNREALTL